MCMALWVCYGHVFRGVWTIQKLSCPAFVDYFQSYLCDVDFPPREHIIPHLLHPTSSSLMTERDE